MPNYDARYMGWHMVIKASMLSEAQSIANQGVDSFGGIVGVDKPTVRRATDDDLKEYAAMGGVINA